MTFQFATVDGVVTTGTQLGMTSELIAFANRYGLLTHIHPGGWAGNAVSTAYPKGGDPLLDAVAAVRVAR